MNEWKKVVRVTLSPHYQVDMLQAKRQMIDGTTFNVRFPNGTVKVLPAIVRRWTIIKPHSPHQPCVQEQVFFADAHEGLSTVWVRAIDIDVQETP